MRSTISNSYITAEIDSFGAELRSIVRNEDKKEYMWEADPKFWGKTSPILFPAIGKFYEGVYRISGKEYEMTKHGFARDREFEIAEQSEDRIVYRLRSDEKTLSVFPYEFELKVEYLLEEGSIREIWHLQNLSKETCFFAFGGHPAFSTMGDRNDASVRIYSRSPLEKAICSEINVKTGYLTGKKYEVPMEKDLIKIEDHIFDNDALVLEKQGVLAAGIVDKDGEEIIRLEAPTCPVWGIWSVADPGAKYICIEPWWGICDEDGYKGDIEKHPYINKVPAGRTWTEGFRLVPNLAHK
ncbi:MAG: aldose 1-epimerase family protein [Acetatifactor sp.]|nr:aldose 1-epimerase family protein [Acetatifactor sp.]